MSYSEILKRMKTGGVVLIDGAAAEDPFALLPAFKSFFPK